MTLRPANPGVFPCSDVSRSCSTQHGTGDNYTGSGIQPLQVYQRAEDQRLVTLVGREDTPAPRPYDSGGRRGVRAHRLGGRTDGGRGV